MEVTLHEEIEYCLKEAAVLGFRINRTDSIIEVFGPRSFFMFWATPQQLQTDSLVDTLRDFMRVEIERDNGAEP